jgi:GNAT superfamily N-acetyltransferase
VIEFRELSERAEDLAILDRFYHDLYVFEFPDADERELLANMTDYLRRKARGWYGKNNYHVLIALEGGRPCGGAISDYLADANAGAIEFLVVDPQQRGSGLGLALLQRTEALLGEDAKRVGKQLDCVVAEMNDPFRPGALDDCFDPFVRLRIWERWGYARLDFPYEQPALSGDQRAVSHLILAAKTSRADWQHGIPSSTVKAVLAGYMRWAMRIDAPEATVEYLNASRYMQGAAIVPLMSLGAYVGVSDEAALVIEEIRDGDDAALGGTLDVYRAAFPGGPADIDADGFRRALRGSNDTRALYHLWAVRSDKVRPVEGVASFFAFAACGFGGYVVLSGSLKGSHRFPLLLARMEEQILRDRLGGEGWFIECAPEKEAMFKRQGFRTVDIDYRQPPLHSDDGKAEVPDLLLMYKEYGRRYATPTLTVREFLGALRQIFAGVYELAAPDSSPAYRHIEAQALRFQGGVVRFR